MSKSKVHLRIEGRVQGVFFRASTMDKARELGLTGWVRNNPDGSVEIVAEGPTEDVEKLVAWSYHGPRHAVVNNVDVDWEPPLDEYRDFSIR
jgi:acylphosphatase